MPMKGYFEKSLLKVSQIVKDATIMTPPHPKQLILFNLQSIEDCNKFIVGSDSDIGGSSEAYWGYTGTNGIFYGNLSLKKPNHNEYERSGYCGIRSKEGDFVLFGKERIDVSLFRYLEITARGDDKRYMINISTELYPTVIWQHRLLVNNDWETIRIPFRDFVRTSGGFVQEKQIQMDKSAIKHIGFSILEQPGPFQLEIQSIMATNTDKTIGDLDIY